MAGTISVTLRSKTVNGEYTNDFNPGSQTIVQNAVGSQAGVLTVSTGGTIIPQDQLTTAGWFEITNTDSNNYITIGPSTSTGSAPFPLLKVKAGESHVTRLSTGIIVKAVADTAQVLLQFNILED
jgi:hypothetical protein